MSKHIDLIGQCSGGEVLSYCIVRLSVAYIGQLLDLVEEVSLLREKHDSIYSIERFDYVPSWYTYIDAEEYGASEDDCALLERNECWVRLERYPDHDKTSAVDIPTTVITADSIYYTATPKHAGDSEKTATATISVADLKAYLQELIPANDKS
jgi:hypothetical protein